MTTPYMQYYCSQASRHGSITMLVYRCLVYLLLLTSVASVSDRGIASLHQSLAGQSPFHNGNMDIWRDISDSHLHKESGIKSLGRPTRMRALQQQAQKVDATVVTTPQQLLDAMEEGSLGSALNIEIRAHLDLTTVTPRDNTDFKRMLNADGDLGSSLGNSIRGNCSTEPTTVELDLPPSPGLGNWQPGQCVLVTDVGLISSTQDLWLHNLYIRHHVTTRSELLYVLWCGSKDCNMWMTDVTIQGDDEGDPLNGGLAVTGGQLYAEGLTIIDFSNNKTALFIGEGSTVNLNGCTLTRNTITDSLTNSAVISVNAVSPDFSDSQQQNTILRLQQCTLTGNIAVNILVSNSDGAPFTLFDVEIYSDEERPVYFPGDLAQGFTEPLEGAPSSRPGIDASSPWFIGVQQTIPDAPAPAAAAPAPSTAPEPATASSPSPVDSPDPASNAASPAPSSDGSGISEGDSNTRSTSESSSDTNNSSSGGGNTIIIIAAVGAVALMCLAAVCFIIICKRRRRSRNQAKMIHGQNNAPQPAIDSAAPAPGPWFPPGAEPKAAAHGNHAAALAVPHPTAYTPNATQNAAPAQRQGVQQVSGLSITSASVANSTTTTSRSNQVPSGMRNSEAAGLITTVSGSNNNQSAPASVTLGSEHTEGANALPQASGFTLPQQHTAGFEQQRAQQHAQQKDTVDMTRTAASLMPPPGAEANHDERMDFLQQQLDSFGTQTPIFDDLVSLGGGDSERRQGGQAVVQMALRAGTMEQYAIKFFVSTFAYNEENELYRQGSGVQGGDLSKFLPKVLKVYSNKDQVLKDAHGHPLPPCIVMERGESLDLWAARRHPDRTQAFTMINQLSLRLKELHSMGYVHRDLKPGNVMWLPRENRWTIIDFGCVARTGEVARLGFSMAYAAPEVIAAYRRGDRTMVAQEAVDVWSLGVMAFELLTGEPALSMVGKEKVMDRIQGMSGLKLPWEGTIQPTVRRQLGIFKGNVLQLLARDPAQRPSMAEFCRSCDRALAGSTSVQL